VRAGTTHESVGFEEGDMLGANMLIAYIGAMFVLYVFCRIYFGGERLELEYADVMHDAADGGVFAPFAPVDEESMVVNEPEFPEL
jgi:hypothetical protein